MNKLTIHAAKSRYIKDVYIHTIQSFGVFSLMTATSSIICHNVTLTPKLMISSYIGLVGFSFYKIFTFNQIPVKTTTNDVGIHEDISPVQRKHNVYKIMGSLGLINGPLALTINSINPLIIPSSIFMASGTILGATALAHTLNDKDIDIVKYQAPLLTGLWGLIGVSVLSSFGYPILSLQNECIAGIALFTALSASDSQAIIKSYDENKLDKYGHALNMGLNFINLAQKIAIMLANNKIETDETDEKNKKNKP